LLNILQSLSGHRAFPDNAYFALITTLTGMQSRNTSQQKLTIGLDLGDRNRMEDLLSHSGSLAHRDMRRFHPQKAQGCTCVSEAV